LLHKHRQWNSVSWWLRLDDRDAAMTALEDAYRTQAFRIPTIVDPLLLGARGGTTVPRPGDSTRTALNI
jgi:hypothetical protein